MHEDKLKIIRTALVLLLMVWAVEAGAAAVTDGPIVPAKGETGSLQVTIAPEAAITNGAQWRRSGTETWLESGITEEDIPAEIFTVEFQKIPGWQAPASVEVTIESGQTAQVSGPAATYLKVHTLTYTAGPGGSLLGVPEQSVVDGGDGSAVTASPAPGYDFSGWSDGILEATRRDRNVTSDITETANFAIKTYTLTYSVGANGSIVGDTPQTVNHGGAGTAVTALPVMGYHFIGWSDDITDNPRTDTNVTVGISVEARFAINTYTLTYTAGLGGAIVGKTPQSVVHGEGGETVSATAETGYTFVNWSDGSTDNPRKDTHVTAAITVTANFVINTYTLTYTAGAGGTLSGKTPQTVNHGGIAEPVTAVADTGYQFVDWSDGNTDNPRTDTNVTKAIRVTANFALKVIEGEGEPATSEGEKPEEEPKEGEPVASEGEKPEEEPKEGEPVASEGEAPEGESKEGEAGEGELDEGEGQIVTPTVARKPLEDAQALIESRGLVSGAITYECNNMLAAGMVISQVPPAGTRVDALAEVDLVVSEGPCPMGCETFGPTEWTNMVLGILAIIILLTVGLFIGEGQFVNPFDILR